MSEKRSLNVFNNINTFMQVELNSIKRDYRIAKIGEVIVTHQRKEDGIYYYQAELAENISFLVESHSKDEFFAKEKLISKLKKKLKDLKCTIKNPIHLRKNSYGTVSVF